VKNKLNMALIVLLLFSSTPCWALSKGALNDKELDYLFDTFFPILVKAQICTVPHGDCIRGQFIFCNSDETLTCKVYGVADKKVIKELFVSMLNSELNVSRFVFYSSKFQEGSIFEKPLLEFIDRTVDK